MLLPGSIHLSKRPF